MANNNLQTSLTIKAGVQGVNQINELSKSIAQAGIDVGELTEAGSELAKEFSSINRQQGLIDNFVKLKKESKDTAQALSEAQKATANLAKEHNEAKQKVAELENAVNQASQAIKETGKATKEQKQALNEQKQALSQAQKEANALQKSFEQSVRHTQNLTKQQDSLNSQLQKTKTAMTEAGVSTKNLYGQKQALSAQAKEAKRSLSSLNDEAKKLKALADAKIAIGLTDYQKTQNELDKVKQAFKDLKASGVLSKKELKIATEQYENKVKELNQELGKTPFQLKNLTQGISGLMASLGVGVGLAEVIQLSDEFNNLEARVRLATQSGGDFNNAMASIKEISDSTMMPLSGAADLFTKLTQSTKELGYSQGEILGLTKTISESIATSGVSAEQASNGLQQLSQAMMGGKVQAEEWNSMIDSIPTVLENVASGLGMTMGELRQHMLDGKLSAEQFLGALQAQAPKIAQEFAQMPKTVSGSLTVLKNSLMGLIGDIDNDIQGNNGLATFILDIANNINNIDPSVLDNLKTSLANVGQVAKVLYDSIAVVPNAIGDVVGAMMGLEAGSGQISLLQGLMNGLALTAGAVADGFKGLQILLMGVVSGAKAAIAELATAFYKLTGVGGEFAKSMTNSANKTGAEFKQLALEFESSLGKAMDTIATDSQTKLGQVADTARAKYEQMAQDGQASAGKLEEAFIDYAQKAIKANDGVVDSTLKQELAQRNLQAVTDETGKVIISSMDKAKKAVDGVDLSKHAESFKALGIDMGEFAGGLSSKANAALTAFNDLAGVAGTNATQLAMAYNGAKQAIGDNATALAELDKALLQATYNSTDLANGIKALAQEQQNAKSATDAQNKALAELGVNMSTINAGMSDGGQKIAESLNVGLTAIKNTATSATALKTALAQALDTATAKAQTVADFGAIKQAIEQAGLASHLTADQIKTLNTGMAGGSEAVKKALADEAHARQAVTQATDTQTKATTDNTTATQANAQSKEALAQATDKATQATEKQAVSEQKVSSGTPYFVGNTQAKILALDKLGASTDQLNQATSTLYQSLSGRTFGTLSELAHAMGQVDTEINKQIQSFTQVSGEVDSYTKKLSSTSVSASDLAAAQGVLDRATNATINGIHVMDKARLDNLKAQIDSTKDKMQDLADTAKNAADSLEAELARMRGDDKKAMQLENAQKVADIEKKLAEARQRGNSEEIRQLERSLSLQQQINQEKLRDVEANQRQRQATKNQAPSHTQSQSKSLSPKEVAGAFGDAIDDAKKQAVNDFARQLMDEAKRLPR